MTQNTPYFVNVKVPASVLLAEQSPELTGLDPLSQNACWFSAQAAHLRCGANGAVEEWRAQGEEDAVARPVKPNTENLHLAPTGGLQFIRKTNAGLVIEAALNTPGRFSLALRFRSDKEARTLLTVNPKRHDTYLFLSEKEGKISWQDQNNTAAVTLDAPRGGGWVIAGYHAGVLSLSTAAQGMPFSPPAFCTLGEETLPQSLDGPNDLFIGCRSHRKGILKTLGESQIYDLLYWPDRDVLEMAPAIINAICRYCEAQEAQQDEL